MCVYVCVSVCMCVHVCVSECVCVCVVVSHGGSHLVEGGVSSLGASGQTTGDEPADDVSTELHSNTHSLGERESTITSTVPNFQFQLREREREREREYQ